MGTPAAYLPPALSTEAITSLMVSLDLPRPQLVESLQAAADYHSIYLVHFSASAASLIPAVRPDSDGSLVLVLRVSGRHIPQLKTRNEVAVMQWVRANTTVPVPFVVRFDATENNAIGHEFTLLERAPGVSVDKIYSQLDETAKLNLVEQLTDFLVQLHSKPWQEPCVSGLSVEMEGEGVAPGPVIDETFWQIPDIAEYWDPDTTFESLNPVDGPYSGWVAFNTACLTRYASAIERHPSLKPYQNMLPRLRRFIEAINSPAYKEKLDNVKYILAHKDMHFANIMCQYPALGGEQAGHERGPRITAVLDWEFAGIVPAPRWNPPRAFLWNGSRSAEAKSEQQKLFSVFEGFCRARGAESLLSDVRASELQEAFQTATNHVRAIVEVCPRNQAKDRVDAWRATAENAMAVFGA